MTLSDKKILIVDDEPKILEAAASFLRSRGICILTAQRGYDALEIFSKKEIDLIILDLMLPDISGEQICKIIRSKSQVPIIMLTAKSAENDLLNGLALGADDYIVKPFSLRELFARIQAVLRRSSENIQKTDTFVCGNLTIDFVKNEALRDGRALHLTPSELKILIVLARNAPSIVSRDKLIEEMSQDSEAFDRSVDSHIKNLRRKMGQAAKYIVTVYGRGYKIDAP